MTTSKFVTTFKYCVLILPILLLNLAQANEKDQATTQINALLDGLHQAASEANLNKYLNSFTKNGVFMGTDDWERWTRPTSLDQYLKDRFKKGTGWTYTSVERHIT